MHLLTQHTSYYTLQAHVNVHCTHALPVHLRPVRSRNWLIRQKAGAEVVDFPRYQLARIGLMLWSVSACPLSTGVSMGGASPLQPKKDLQTEALAAYAAAIGGLEFSYGSGSDHPALAALHGKVTRVRQFWSVF